MNTVSRCLLVLVLFDVGCTCDEVDVDEQPAEAEPAPAGEAKRPETKKKKSKDPKKQHVVAAIERARARKQAENAKLLDEAHRQDIGDAPLEGGAESLDGLARRVLELAAQGDAEGLRAIAVDLPQYRRLFPAMAESASAFKLGPAFLWDDMSSDSNDGLRHAIEDRKGKMATFVRTEIGRSRERGKLRIHDDVDIVFTEADGVEQRFRFVRHVVEHTPTGTFKVLRYR